MRGVNLPVHRVSSVVFDTIEAARAEGPPAIAGELHRSTYATSGTETTQALCDAVAAMEGAPHDCRAALMPSGLAAISTALLAFTRPGEQVLMSDSVYGPARVFAQGMLSEFGVRTRFFDPRAGSAIEQMIEPETRVLYLESPGSYTFEIQDIPLLCEIAQRRGLVSMVDNTYASPMLARPFDWGVDLSLLALTKYWSGHSDLLMGAVVARAKHWPRLWGAVKQLGQCVGGDDAWLVLRGLRTVEVRMRQHEQCGLEVARWLQTRPEVGQVLHPGLATHPDHALFERDFLGANGLFSFELAGTPKPGAAAIAALVNRRRHFRIAYSWGGFESLIMPAAIDTMRTVSPWRGGPLIRLHCGLERAEDLIADLDEGFAAMNALRGRSE